MINKLIMVGLLSSLLAGYTVGGIYKLKSKEVIVKDSDVVVIKYEVVEEVKEEVEEQPKVNDTYIGEFSLTGYCDCPICQEEYVGQTATGNPPTPYYTVAVDPDIIPLGTRLKIEGFDDIIFSADDVGGMINEYHIDVLMPSHEECYNDICNRTARVWIVEE